MTEWSGVNAVDVVDRRDRSAVGDVLSREVVLPWLVSRVLAIGALVLADSVSGHGLDFDALVDWDGRWYLDIAQQGYGRGPIPAHWMVHDWSRWPFFPLLPSVTRLLSGSGIPAALTIVLINNAAFLLALVGVHRLAGRRMNDEARQLAVWAMVLFPGSITSVMGFDVCSDFVPQLRNGTPMIFIAVKPTRVMGSPPPTTCRPVFMRPAALPASQTGMLSIVCSLA